MARRQNDSEASRFFSLALLLLGFISCAVIYTVLALLLNPNSSSSESETLNLATIEENYDGNGGGCCRGIENLELWGPAVKWGSDFKFNTSRECCEACKAMCNGSDGPCLCDTWVYCGNRKACGSKFGECWLKKQKDILSPDRQEAGDKVSWTSGLIFGKGEGIIGLETKYGTLHIKLFPECAPHSVTYILELLNSRHCIGCEFFRAESRGQVWDSKGNHIEHASFGPPFALIQGTLEAHGTEFRKIPKEVCPTIKRGSVAWVGSGPEFMISLANHHEWKRSYTVFGSVLIEDMGIAEKIAQLPTKADVWNNINVSVLVNPVPISFRRIKMAIREIDINAKSS